ncbi:hypothetical protein OAE08_02010 [Gammaproteobacteria bacterium]|nr:hypothetical protein [Gammaproteobacteria bacterium]
MSLVRFGYQLLDSGKLYSHDYNRGGLLCLRSDHVGLSADLHDRDNVGDLVITGIDEVVDQLLLYRHY